LVGNGRTLPIMYPKSQSLVRCSAPLRREVNLTRSIDPATKDVLGTIPELGISETKEAIDAAAKAFPAWSTTTAKASLSNLLAMVIELTCAPAST